jgi:hypothetical protein
MTLACPRCKWFGTDAQAHTIDTVPERLDKDRQMGLLRRRYFCPRCLAPYLEVVEDATYANPDIFSES